MRETVDLETTGPSNASSSAASTSRTESPRRKEQTTSASSACVRATPLPTIALQKPSVEALRTRGRSSSSGPAVVFTVTGS